MSTIFLQDLLYLAHDFESNNNLKKIKRLLKKEKDDGKEEKKYRRREKDDGKKMKNCRRKDMKRKGKRWDGKEKL